MPGTGVDPVGERHPGRGAVRDGVGAGAGDGDVGTAGGHHWARRGDVGRGYGSDGRWPDAVRPAAALAVDQRAHDRCPGERSTSRVPVTVGVPIAVDVAVPLVIINAVAFGVDVGGPAVGACGLFVDSVVFADIRTVSFGVRADADLAVG